MNIKANISNILNDLDEKVQLVAVSKTKPNNYILEAYQAGQRIFGENKVQELVKKHNILPNDIQWHMIGHLQTNKVKYIAPFVSLIHSVDSKKLLIEIDKRAKQNDRVIHCLLQIHIAQESNKFGLNENEALELLEMNLSNISIDGLMGMATFTDDKRQIRSEFKSLKNTFEKVRREFNNLFILSMGMSGDYDIAIKEGSNMIRIGSSIFGSR
ncbi:MAG: YggS family pyridoxal phosphate-dependent enzyme [Flavobacteriales bacterium]|nr:YggS family pyridoxal phosphate-dependent enzyme [Flavobacteriales bacterium]|tara:strand:+ start:1085 stop:1723 length:639 start_codon:yes stop_codon:yes gene_type:complete